MKHTNKGKFIPKNIYKYKGNPYNIIYRSSYELKLMSYLDKSRNVIEWSSESIVVPYLSPIDNRKRKYYVDFYAKVLEKNNTVTNYLLEVKPKKFTVPPKKRDTNAYIKETKEYLKNQAKWSAAHKYCREHNYKFKIITEEDLNI